MVRTIVAAGLGMSLLAAPALAQSTPTVTQKDQHFLQHAARDNQGEIRLALMAVKQAANPAVRAYARLMVNDHVALETQLANVMGELRVPSANGLTQEDRSDRQKLRPLYGTRFDLTFMQAQVQDHAQDVQNFARELQTTRTFQVSALAATTLPVLQQHLALAEAVQRYVVQSEQQGMAGQQR